MSMPHLDDLKAAQELVGRDLEARALGTVTGRLSSYEIAELLSAAREQGAIDEREACAKICDHWARPRHADDLDLDDSRWKVMQAAAAIRARAK